MNRNLLLSAAAMAAMLTATQASAGINGTVVGLKGYYPDQSTVLSDAGSAVVGPGIEFPSGSLPSYPFDFDLSDTQISLVLGSDETFFPVAFNGFGFKFSSVVPISASIDGASEFNPISISIVGDTLFLNYSGVSFLGGQPSIIDLQFGAAVPEPALWLTMILGFGMTGATLRRRSPAAV